MRVRSNRRSKDDSVSDGSGGRDLARDKELLIDSLKRRGYLRSSEAVMAMEKVPREEFMPPEIRSMAYVDTPQPIGHGQTISAPHMVAIMTEALMLETGHRVLEIGGGSGYHAAVVAEMVRPGGKVISTEIVRELAREGADNIRRAGYQDTVQFVQADGSVGYPDGAPFDRIHVACASPGMPRELTEQLADGGFLLIPVGSGMFCDLIRIEKRGGKVRKESLGGCSFVPMRGRHGF